MTTDMGCSERQRRVLAQMIADERLTLLEAAKDVDPFWLLRWRLDPQFRKILAVTEELQRDTLRHKCLVARLSGLARPPAPATRPPAAQPAGEAGADGAAAEAPPFGPPPLADDGQRTFTNEEIEELIRQCTPAKEDKL